MSSTRANFDRSWDIFTDIALHPAFTKEDVDLVKSRLVASLSDDKDEPDSYLQRLQEKVAYAGHPYLNRPEGTAEIVSKLTAEDLRAYHQRVMQTSHLLLVIVGDLDAAQLKSRLAGTFGKLPRGDYKAQTPPALAFNASTLDVTTRELPTNYIQGFYTAPPIIALNWTGCYLGGHIGGSFSDEKIGQFAVPSPGGFGFPPSFAWLTVEHGKFSWETVPLR